MNNWEDISALADDQLDASKAADMRRAMEADPNLRSQYEDLLSIKRSLRNNLPSHDSPETLSLCLDRIREIDRVGKTENVVHRFRYAIATGLAALLIGVGVYNQAGPNNVLDRSAIARSLSAGATGGGEPIRVEGPASQWLREQIAMEPVSEELKVTNMDQLVVDGRAVGRYFLTDGEADYIYLITPGVADCDGVPVPGYEGIKHSQINGLNALTWCESNMSFVFVSREPVDRMLGFIRSR